MSNAVKKDEISFVFRSPGTEAYKIRLNRHDGGDGTEFVIAGRDDTVTKSLRPGRYNVRMESLSGRQGLLEETLELDPNNLQVNLADILHMTPSTERLIEKVTLGNMKMQMPRPSVLRKQMKMVPLARKAYIKTAKSSKTGAIKKIIKDHQENIAKSDKAVKSSSRSQDRIVLTKHGYKAVEIDFESSLALEESSTLSLEDASIEAASQIHIAPRRFSIGVSEKKVGGVWSAAKTGQFTVQEGTNGELWIYISEIDLDRNRYSRLTVSIEGLSSIRVPLLGLEGGCRIGVFPEFKYGNLDASIELQAQNGKLQSLLIALSEFDNKETSKVLNWVGTEIGSVKPIFQQKYEDPWAATLAAIFYAKSGEMGEYVQWAYNLARAGSNISDASIIAAWARAIDMTGTIQEAEKQILNYLIEARKIGAPNFVQTNLMALDLLNSLIGTAHDKTVRLAARNEKLKRARRSRHRVFDGAVFMWEEPKNHLRKGILPKERYKIIKSGMLKGTRWYA